MSHTDPRDWKKFKGLSQAKIAQIKAVIEIGRRFREDEIKETSPKIKSAKDAVDIMMPRMRDLKKEIFKVLLLNSQNKIVDNIEITEGTVNQATPIIREILQKAPQKYAVSIICVHNHPSGNPSLSIEDKTFTRDLAKAGKILNINVLDHIVIGDNKYFSFANEGMM